MLQKAFSLVLIGYFLYSTYTAYSTLVLTNRLATPYAQLGVPHNVDEAGLKAAQRQM